MSLGGFLFYEIDLMLIRSSGATLDRWNGYDWVSVSPPRNVDWPGCRIDTDRAARVLKSKSREQGNELNYKRSWQFLTSRRSTI